MSVGNFPYTGGQRSYSFEFFHADSIPTSLTAVRCPAMPCEQVFLQNDPGSTGNIIIGELVHLQTTGRGYLLEPGDVTGWIPVKNLDLIAHLDAAGSYLRYMIIR